MTDSQRSCFLAVAEHRSFSRAAAALYVSQPAVSKNISTLESELGVPLFDRQGKYIVLTRAGEIFQSFLTEYQREYESMMRRIRSLDRSSPFGTVRIGCGITWNAAHFHTRLSRHFAIHFPGIKLEVVGMDPENFMPALRRKDVDLLIMYGHDLDRQQDIEHRQLASIGTGFLCSSLLLDSDSATLEELCRHPLLLAENYTDKRGSGVYRQLIIDYFEQRGLEPEFLSCRSMASGIVDLSCGKGSLLVDDWTAAISNSEFRYIPSGESVPINLVWLHNSADSLLKLVTVEIAKVFQGNF